jgi:hypothetical protein
MAALQKTQTTSIKVASTTHARLQEIARKQERPMGEVIANLVARYEDEEFWTAYRQAYENLRKDPVAWKEYEDEVKVWDQLSGDGLEHEEPYFTAEEAERELNARSS